MAIVAVEVIDLCDDPAVAPKPRQGYKILSPEQQEEGCLYDLLCVFEAYNI